MLEMLMHIDIDLFRRRFSGRLIPFQLDVFQYSSPDFNQNTRTKETDFSLDIIDLSYSTARTLCSYHLTKKELYFDVIASLMSHLNFIDVTQTNLLLSESRYKRLRDFSKSTRIGEMAQGINALFVERRLGFPYIIDFDLAKNHRLSTLNIQTSGKTPDFVVLDTSLTRIGLFESKGNMNGNVAKDLRNAMEQINSVFNPTCIGTKIPVSTKFQDNNDFSKKQLRKIRKSSINYGRIETVCVDTKDASLLRKLNYASWFYLVGDFTRVNSILNEGIVPVINDGDPNYELDTETDKGNPIFWVRDPLSFSVSNESLDLGMHLFITSRYFFDGEFKIGIYKKAIDDISGTSASNEPFDLPEGEINYLRKYPDGTLIYLRSNI